MSDDNLELRVQSGAVDTHCHLFLMEEEPAVAVEAARAAGVDRMICVGVDVESSRRSLEMADSLPGVFATAGVHPHDASTFDATSSSAVEQLLHDPRVLAVGECGLDYFRMHSPREDQRRVLAAHAAMSIDSGKPMVVHVRDAWDDTFAVLDEANAERVVIHCFSGGVTEAEACTSRGWWMSFAGNVTYPKNEHLRRAASSIPAHLLLAETDSPYLSPQPRRGRDNEPAHVLLTLGVLAEVRSVDVEELVAITSENARTAFPGLL